MCAAIEVGNMQQFYSVEITSKRKAACRSKKSVVIKHIQ
jgi:hypothetical protein